MHVSVRICVCVCVHARAHLTYKGLETVPAKEDIFTIFNIHLTQSGNWDQKVFCCMCTESSSLRNVYID